jgi:uncharacterized membrane protein YccC
MTAYSPPGTGSSPFRRQICPAFNRSILPPTAVGIPILVTLGSLVMMLLNRREDIITTAITTIVVIVVAIMSPAHAQGQPLLRLFDTVVGIGVGVACKWTASAVFSSLRREGAETGKH